MNQNDKPPRDQGNKCAGQYRHDDWIQTNEPPPFEDIELCAWREVLGIVMVLVIVGLSLLLLVK